MKPHHQLYFIAIVPPEPILSEIETLKQALAKQYDTHVALKSPAHITLYKPFEWKKAEEQQLQEVLEDFAKQQAPLEIELSGYDCFAPRVLFVHPVEHPLLTHIHQALVRSLKEKLGLKRYENYPKPFRAHLTIANRDISEANFNKAWATLQQRSYNRIFMAKGFVLFRHNGKNWDTFHYFNFQKNNVH